MYYLRNAVNTSKYTKQRSLKVLLLLCKKSVHFRKFILLLGKRVNGKVLLEFNFFFINFGTNLYKNKLSVKKLVKSEKIWLFFALIFFLLFSTFKAHLHVSLISDQACNFTKETIFFCSLK